MSLEKAKEYLKKQNLEKNIMEFNTSSATVEEAAKALNCAEKEIAKTLSFLVNENVKVYLDESLKRFNVIYPACGSSNSAVKLTIADLEKTSNYEKWIDVCKDM